MLEKRMTEEEGEEVPADEEEEFEVQYARLRKVVDGLPRNIHVSLKRVFSE